MATSYGFNGNMGHDTMMDDHEYYLTIIMPNLPTESMNKKLLWLYLIGLMETRDLIQ